MSSARAALDALPRLGWIEGPSPVQALPARGRVAWLGVKREDQLPALAGGGKPRKLDTLLAHAPWKDAAAWVSAGAIGSGHLVACAAAGERLGRATRAHLFWEPVTPHALENLAYVATRTSLDFHANRVFMALSAPGVLLGKRLGDAAVIPPGGTVPEGMIGVARAAFELADQIAAGDLPKPDRIYVALGSGGTAVGLAVGLGLAGLRIPVHAIATVERVLMPDVQVRHTARAFSRWLAARGVPAAEPAPLRIVHSQIGAGYGIPTPASWAAVSSLHASGIPAEPVYTGKAWAALVADLEADRVDGNVLYWFTSRRALPEPAPGWRDRLPANLRRRLDAAPIHDGAGPGGSLAVPIGAAALVGAAAAAAWWLRG